MNYLEKKSLNYTPFDRKEYIIIFLIASIFSITIYLLLPFSTKKYILEITNESPVENIFASYLADLDSDNSTEYIRFKINNGIAAISLENSNKKIIEQINLKGKWVEHSVPSTADLDKDGYLEIVCFTYFNDSVWINILEPLQKTDPLILHMPIDRVSLIENNQDWQVNISEPANLTGNYYDDLVISIYSGFTLEPRKLYILDVNTNILATQPVSLGNNIIYPVTVDIDLDGVPEISGSTFSPDNLGDKSAVLSDSLSWLLLYDTTLNLKTQPVFFSGSPSYITVFPFLYQNDQLLIVYYRHKDHDESQPSHLMSYKWINDSLVKMKTVRLSSNSHSHIIGNDPINPGLFYFQEKDLVYAFTGDLRMIRKINIGIHSSKIIWQTKDLDLDGNHEFLAFSYPGTLTIFRSGFKKTQEIELPHVNSKFLLSNNSGDKPGEFQIYSNNRIYELIYMVNPHHYYRWILFLLILLLNFAIFLLFASFLKRRIQEGQKKETALLHYQLTNVQQQLDPHFLFNILNNISYFYLEGKKDDATHYLAKITSLVTDSLENSERLTISLKEELKFTTNYLFLEKLRSNDKFEFSADIRDEDILNIQIPKMLIQNFAENAVKHGIFHLTKRKGYIQIYSTNTDEHINIIIEDNGIGRKKAKELNTFGTGKGIRIIDRILILYEKLKGIRIYYVIEDLYADTGEPSGTKVIIKIPSLE